MIRLRLDVSDVVHMNEHTKYANCSLHENFLNFFNVIMFCLVVEKDNFEQMLLHWP